MSQFRLGIVSTDKNAAYRFARECYGITSNDLEVFDTENLIKNINQTTVVVVVPYVQDGGGLLRQAIRYNKNVIAIPYMTSIELGENLAKIFKDSICTALECGSDLKTAYYSTKMRIDLNIPNSELIDFKYRIANGQVDVVPKNQPTAAYLIFARKSMKAL